VKVTVVVMVMVIVVVMMMDVVFTAMTPGRSWAMVGT
jgi:hypothetical protein